MVSMSEMPDDIAALTDDIRRNVKPIAIQPGWYIWTQPYPQNGEADIDLTEAMQESDIATVLSESVVTGRLIVQVDDQSIQTFISGERANRTAFVARLSVGNLLFGVLSVK
jgi:hypothetical protein